LLGRLDSLDWWLSMLDSPDWKLSRLDSPDWWLSSLIGRRRLQGLGVLLWDLTDCCGIWPASAGPDRLLRDLTCCCGTWQTADQAEE